MKVRSKQYRAVWLDGRHVIVINQPLLPHRFELLRLRNHQETARALRTIIIRGAGTIGATAGYRLAQACLEAPARGFAACVRRACQTLLVTRAANPAFDATPAKDITGIITERGSVRPGQSRQVFGHSRP